MLRKEEVLQMVQYSYGYSELKNRVKLWLKEQGKDDSDEAVNEAIAERCMTLYHLCIASPYEKKMIDPDNNPDKLLKMTNDGANKFFVLQSEKIQNEKIKTNAEYESVSPVELILCFFLGSLGAHKFYRKQYGMGVLYLCTLGLFGIGVLVDLIKILIRMCKK